MNRFFIALLLMSSTLLAAPASQPAAPAQPDTDSPIVTRVYDVEKLSMQIADYPLPPGFLSQPGDNTPAPTPPDRPQRLTANSLQTLIENAIDPATWKDNGGSTGGIQILPGRLVITQTEAIQDKIHKLLNDLLAEPQKTVRVSATWLLLDQGEMKILLANSPPSAGSAIVRIDGGALSMFKPYCAGQTMGFDRQTIHIAQTSSRSYVSDLTPIVGNGVVGYQTTMAEANSGVGLQILPTLSNDGKSVVLDLQNIVSEVSGIDHQQDAATTMAATQPASDATPERKVIDRPVFVGQRFQTTVEIPLGVNVLVGGMTFDPSNHTESPRQLYLIVEADAAQ
jgi:hypothetical protein